MTFTFAHNNFNVRDLDKSLTFYKEALGLTEVRRKEAADGSFTLVFLGDGGGSSHQLELTWLRDWDRPYNLGDNEFHLAFIVEDFEAAHEHHKQWAASVLRTRRWAFTSSATRTATGWRSCPPSAKTEKTAVSTDTAVFYYLNSASQKAQQSLPPFFLTSGGR